MTDINNSVVSESLTAYARKLRKNQTKAEELLWELLRNRQLNNLKFKRQHPIHPSFILDFYCHEKKIAIEVDGIHHAETLQQNYDEERTGQLNFLGIKVLRFTNEEVLNQTEKVLQQILLNCNERPSYPSPAEESESMP